jgi:hypothetical protein
MFLAQMLCRLQLPYRSVHRIRSLPLLLLTGRSASAGTGNPRAPGDIHVHRRHRREISPDFAGGWPQNPPSPTPVDREEKGVYSSYPQTVKNFAASRAVLMLPGAAFRRWRSAWEQEFVEAVFPEGATPLRRAARDRRHAQASGLSGMCVWRDLKKDPVCPPYSKCSPTAQNG